MKAGDRIWVRYSKIALPPSLRERAARGEQLDQATLLAEGIISDGWGEGRVVKPGHRTCEAMVKHPGTGDQHPMLLEIRDVLGIRNPNVWVGDFPPEFERSAPV
jgi:hypothetical protein